MKERKIYFFSSIAFFIIFTCVALSEFQHKFWFLCCLPAIYPFIMNRTKNGYLPVLMYHSVSDYYKKYPVSHLSISRRNFKWAMWYLHFRGYHTLSLHEAYLFSRGAPINRKSIVLTFDDGFLDNWINAFAILKHYNLKGTIFVTADFIVKDDRIRENRAFDDDSQVIEKDERGYLSIGEIKKMYHSGVFEFYPHGKTHTWYFKSDKVVDFHKHGDRYYWLDWNNDTSAKPFWMQFWPQSNVPEGMPVFEFGKSLEIRRFLPDDSLINTFLKSVAKEKHLPPTEKLEDKWKNFVKNYPAIGRYEKEDEYQLRTCSELTAAKEFLERLINKKLLFFCWPGGGKNEFALKTAYEKIGYLMTTTHQDAIPNGRGNFSRYLYRVSGGYSMLFENRLWNLLKFISHVETYRRNYTWIWLFGLIEIVEMCAKRLGKTRRQNDRCIYPNKSRLNCK